MPLCKSDIVTFVQVQVAERVSVKLSSSLWRGGHLCAPSLDQHPYLIWRSPCFPVGTEDPMGWFQVYTIIWIQDMDPSSTNAAHLDQPMLGRCWLGPASHPWRTQFAQCTTGRMASPLASNCSTVSVPGCRAQRTASGWVPRQACSSASTPPASRHTRVGPLSVAAKDRMLPERSAASSDARGVCQLAPSRPRACATAAAVLSCSSASAALARSTSSPEVVELMPARMLWMGPWANGEGEDVCKGGAGVRTAPLERG